MHYWASPLEAGFCAGEDVAVVGGGNSAGQAVVFLASRARKVWLLIRGASLEESMSRYLVDRIGSLSNVELVPHAEVIALEGPGDALEAVTWRDTRAGAATRRPLRHLFLFIGADPNTAWLAGSASALDAKGFVLTRADAATPARPMETSVPGVFAIGDVRSGSTKRVAAAVGEGAQVVAALHAYLADARRLRPCPTAREIMMPSDVCTHGASIRRVIPSARGCEECIAMGSPWVHLRLCRACGHVGCCDDSPHRHATAHFAVTGHPVIEGYDPPEGWGWCYVDEVFLDFGGRHDAQVGPIPRYV